MAETQNSTHIDQTDPRESFGIFAPENFAVALFFISPHSRFMVLFGIFFFCAGIDVFNVAENWQHNFRKNLQKTNRNSLINDYLVGICSFQWEIFFVVVTNDAEESVIRLKLCTQIFRLGLILIDFWLSLWERRGQGGGTSPKNHRLICHSFMSIWRSFTVVQ